MVRETQETCGGESRLSQVVSASYLNTPLCDSSDLIDFVVKGDEGPFAGLSKDGPGLRDVRELGVLESWENGRERRAVNEKRDLGRWEPVEPQPKTNTTKSLESNFL